MAVALPQLRATGLTGLLPVLAKLTVSTLRHRPNLFPPSSPHPTDCCNEDKDQDEGEQKKAHQQDEQHEDEENDEGEEDKKEADNELDV